MVLSLFVGFINGFLVVRTGIPSFLITLGTFFVLQGANLGITKLVTGAVSTKKVSDMEGFDSAKMLVLRHHSTSSGVTVKITVIWWLLFVLLVHLDPEPDQDRQLDLRGRRGTHRARGRSVYR